MNFVASVKTQTSPIYIDCFTKPRTHLHKRTVFTFSPSTDIRDKDIIGNAIICMIAGYDTTSSSLSWFIYDMVLHPECQQKLIDEIDEHIGQVGFTVQCDSFMILTTTMILSRCYSARSRTSLLTLQHRLLLLNIQFPLTVFTEDI